MNDGAKASCRCRKTPVSRFAAELLARLVSRSGQLLAP